MLVPDTRPGRAGTSTQVEVGAAVSSVGSRRGHGARSFHAIQKIAVDLGAVVDGGDHGLCRPADDHLGEVGPRALMPWSFRYSLRWSPRVAMDLTLTTSVTPCLMMSATMRLASCLSRAQWTMPRAVVAPRPELPEQFRMRAKRLKLDGLGGAAQVLPVRHFRDALGAWSGSCAGGVGPGCGASACWPASCNRHPREGGNPQAEGVLGDGDGGAPAAGVESGRRAPDERCGHVRSPVRCEGRCCPRRAGPRMPGFRRGAWADAGVEAGEAAADVHEAGEVAHDEGLARGHDVGDLSGRAWRWRSRSFSCMKVPPKPQQTRRRAGRRGSGSTARRRR